MNAQWDERAHYEQDMALFSIGIEADREQFNPGLINISNWRDADASQDMKFSNDENGDTSSDITGVAADTVMIDTANTFVDEDQAAINRIFFDESTVLQYNGDHGGDDAFASNTETTQEEVDASQVMDNFRDFARGVKKTGVVKGPVAKGPGVVKTQTTKPLRKKYEIKDPVKKALVMKINRENAQKSRDLAKASDIRLKEELDLLRIEVAELRAFKNDAHSYLRENAKEDGLFLALNQLRESNLM